MKRTLLDMTQSILSSLSSDEVNSISDNPESLQVADIIKNTYFNIISRANITDHEQLIQLDPSLDASLPVLMYVPAGIGKITYLKYFDSNISSGQPIPGYQYVNILPTEEFLRMVESFNPGETNVFSYTFSDNSNNFPADFTLYYKNDKQPQYCTILSNFYVLFDGYDATVDSTLQASKTQACGMVIPVWSNTDDFVPDLSEEQFTLLYNEAKSLAFFELKQSAHPKAEQEAKRQWSVLQKTKSIINRPTYFDQLPNFGRRGFHGSFFKRMGWDRSSG